MDQPSSVQRVQKSKIDFDKLADDLGGLGRYQIITYLLGCFGAYVSGLVVVLTVFTTYKNPHRCHIPVCDSDNSSYEEYFTNFTIPYNGNNKLYDECSMHKFSGATNKTNEEGGQCYPKYFDVAQTTNCTEWIFDRELFQSTTVTSFELVCDKSFLIPLGSASFMSGMVTGSFFIGVIADKYGRKNGLLVSITLFGLCGLGSAIAPNYLIFLVFQLFTGAGAEGLFEMGLINAIELISLKWRAFFSVMVNVPFALGETSSGVLAYFIREWRWLQAACTAPVLILLLQIGFMQESVRWLVSQNRIEDAVKVVDKAAKVNNIPSPSCILRNEDESEDFEVHLKMENETRPKRSMLNLLKKPNMRKKSLVLFFSWTVCSLAYYGLSKNSGKISGNIFVNYILMMVIEIPSYLLTYHFLNRIGRKGTMMLTFLIGGTACLISGLIPSDLKLLILSLNLLGKFGAAGAFGANCVYAAELYPTEYRCVGVGSCFMFARFGGVLYPFILSLSNIYQTLPQLIFGILSFIAGFLLILLPETLGSDLPQTLEESENFGKDQPWWYFGRCCTRKIGKKDEIIFDEVMDLYTIGSTRP